MKEKLVYHPIVNRLFDLMPPFRLMK